MGLFDKAKGLVGKNSGQVKGGIDKAADLADDQIGDKVGEDKIDMAAEHAKDAVDKLDD